MVRTRPAVAAVGTASLPTLVLTARTVLSGPLAYAARAPGSRLGDTTIPAGARGSLDSTDAARQQSALDALNAAP